MKPRRRQAAILLCAVAFIAAALWLQSCSREPEACSVCLRHFHRGMEVTLAAGGKQEKTCCPSCALHYRALHEKAEIQSVTDYNTNRAIEPRSASYVFGSDVEPCSEGHEAIRTGENTAVYKSYDRCAPSIVAFLKSSDAAAFQKAHGGKVLDFAELRTVFVKGE